MAEPDRFSLHHRKERPDISANDLRLIARWLPAAGRILDIGSGHGGFVELAGAAGFFAVGLDRNPDVVVLWRERVSGVVADALMLPFVAGAFDVVRAKDVMEHFPDPLQFVATMRRVTRPGGLLVIHTPSVWSTLYPVANFWDEYTHIRPFTRLALERVAIEADLRVLCLKGYTAGRTPLERVLTNIVGRVLPHSYLLVAQVPLNKDNGLHRQV
jgi:SAM-dependent methyltransferase